MLCRDRVFCNDLLHLHRSCLCSLCCSKAMLSNLGSVHQSQWFMLLFSCASMIYDAPVRKFEELELLINHTLITYASFMLFKLPVCIITWWSQIFPRYISAAFIFSEFMLTLPSSRKKNWHSEIVPSTSRNTSLFCSWSLSHSTFYFLIYFYQSSALYLNLQSSHFYASPMLMYGAVFKK